MIDFRKLIDIRYLLDPNPGYDWQFLYPVLVIVVLALVSGIALSFIRPLAKTGWRDPIAQWLRWLSAVSLVLIFFRYEGLLFLSVRLLWYLVGLGFLVWLGTIIRQLRQIVPTIKEKTERYQTFEKYLPRPKAH